MVEDIKKIITIDTTALIASHDIKIIKNYCPKTVWLDGGKVIDYGKTDEVIAKYLSSIDQ